MANFVTCNTLEIKCNAAILQNQPVNLDLCYTFKKDKSVSYVDSKVGNKPSIKFSIADGRGTTVTWVYEDELTRDTDFDDLFMKARK